MSKYLVIYCQYPTIREQTFNTIEEAQTFSNTVNGTVCIFTPKTNKTMNNNLTDTNHRLFSDATIKRADELISTFKDKYQNVAGGLDFICSQYLSGEVNKELRRCVIYRITHEVKPLSKCTMFAVSTCLSGAISQSSLF